MQSAYTLFEQARNLMLLADKAAADFDKRDHLLALAGDYRTFAREWYACRNGKAKAKLLRRYKREGYRRPLLARPTVKRTVHPVPVAPGRAPVIPAPLKMQGRPYVWILPKRWARGALA